MPRSGHGWRWRSGEAVIPGRASEPVIGPRFARTRWREPGIHNHQCRVRRQSCRHGGYGFRACAQERVSRNDGALRNRPGIKKADPRPAFFVDTVRPRRSEAPPEPSKLLLLVCLLLGLLGLLRCLLRFLSHSILVWVNGWKRDSEACSGRASLATASIVIPTDSRRAAPQCHAAVITLSTAVLRFFAFSAALPSLRGA